jgi:hypothetical protein
MNIENEKEHCASSTSNRLAKASIWREGLSVRYPQDQRNARAAESLAELAKAFADLPDSEWAELKPLYKLDCPRWQEAVSITAKRVGFQYGRTLPIFVMNLIGLLSQPSIAA